MYTQIFPKIQPSLVNIESIKMMDQIPMTLGTLYNYVNRVQAKQFSEKLTVC